MPTAMQDLLKQHEGFIPLNSTTSESADSTESEPKPPEPPKYSGPAVAPVSMVRRFSEPAPPARAMVNALAEAYGVTFAQALAWTQERSADIQALA